MIPSWRAWRVSGSRVARSWAMPVAFSAAQREIASAAASSSAQNLPHGRGTPACPARARPVAGRRRISSAAADSRPAAAHDSVRCQAVRTPISSSSLTPG